MTTIKLAPFASLEPNVKKQHALEALLEGKSVTEAAAHANVSRQAVHAWLQDAKFSDRLQERRQAQFTAVQLRLSELADQAVECVATALRNGDARIGIRVLMGLGLLGGASRATAGADFMTPESKLSMVLRSVGTSFPGDAPDGATSP
ncbi:MAG: hypothetical protein ABR548_07070 [Actinomycetota bacterium]